MERMRGMVGVVAAVAVAALAGAARAETSAEARIRALEEQLRRTQRQIEELKGMVEQQKAIGQATAKQAEQAAEQAKTATTEVGKQKVLAGWKDGFYLESPDGSYKLKLRGYMQGQGRFPFGKDTDATNSSFFLRRVRPIFEGTVAKYFDFKIMPDFGQGQAVIEDAYMDVTYFGPELKLRGGKEKVPLSLERLQSSEYLTFIERSIVNRLTPNRDVGFYFFGDLLASRLTYQVGAFDGSLDNASNDGDVNDGKELAARVFGHPFLGTGVPFLTGLGFGVGGTYGNDDDGENLSGLNYRTAERVTFFKYLTSSTITATQSGRRARVDPQGYYFWGPFALMGELVWTNEGVKQVNSTTDASKEAIFNNRGFMAQASYVLTGENASYKGVVPANSFDPRNGHWGAFEVGLRGSQIHFDEDTVLDGFSNPKLTANDASEITAGVNWYFNKNFKFMVNYNWTNFDHSIEINDELFKGVQSFLMQMQLAY